MSLLAILQWIGFAVVVLSVTAPFLWAFIRMGEGEDEEKATRSGCGCLVFIWQLGFMTAVIATIVKASMRYLL